MTQDRDSGNKLSELRQRAEATLAEKAGSASDASTLSSDDLKSLIHELQVHQIELEMQNEELRQTQLALEASRDNFSELYDFAPVGYVTLNDKGIILEANLTAVQLLGVERKSLIKRPFSRFVSQEFGDAYYLYLKQVFETQSKQKCEIKLARKDGTHFYVQLESVVVQDESGEFNRCRTIVTDISDRKKAESELLQINEAVRESEKKFKTMTEHSPLAMLVTQGIDEKVEYLSPRFTELFGYTHADIPEVSAWWPLAYPDEEYRSFVANEWRRRVAEAIETRREIEPIESVVTCSNGTQKTIYWGLVSLGDKNIVYGMDITERKKAEASLRESENRFRGLFENAPIGIFYSTPEGKFVAVNNALATMAGYDSPQEMIDTVNKTSIAEAVYVEQLRRPELVSKVTEARAEWLRAENLYRRRDDSLFLGELTFRAAPDITDGSEILVGFVSDITDRKKAESELRTRDSAIKTALNAIAFADPDGTIWYVNDAFVKLWGLEKNGDALGLHVSDFCDTEEASRAFAEFHECGHYSGEIMARKKTSTLFHLQLSASTVFDDYGKPSVMMASFSDITDRKQAENALRESEEHYRAVFENAGIGIDLLDRHGRIVKVNQALLNILGYAEEELTQRTFLDITHPDDRETSKRNLESLASAEIDWYRLEKRYVRKDGGIVWVDLWSSAVRAANGEHVGTVAVIEDITDRKKAEEDLRVSEEKYRILVETAQEAILVAQDGFHKFVNPAAARIWGRCEEELLSRPFGEFIHPDDKEMVLDRSSRRTRGEDAPRHYAHRVLTEDGETRWVEVNSATISWEGKPAVQVFATDITERKQAEQKIESEKRRFEILVETSPYGIAMIRQDGSYEYVNPMFREIFGYDLSDIPTGRDWSRKAFPDPDYRHEVIEMWFQDSGKASSDQFVPRILTVTCKDGTWKIVKSMLVRLPSGEHMITFEDITERRAAEEALRESEERLRLAWETVPGALAITRLEDGTYVDVNHGFSLLSGYNKEEIVGKSSVDIPIWHDPASRQRYVSCLLTDGHVKNFETQMRRKDGQLRTVLMSGTQMTLNGQPHILSVGDDIEDLYRAQESLRESEERYRQITENSLTGIFLYQDGRGVFANKRAAEMVGYTPEEGLSKPFLELIHPDDRRMVEEMIKARISGKPAPESYELRLLHKDGHTVWTEIMSHRIDYQGRPALLGTIADVTQSRILEEQLRQAQKMEAIGTLAGGIAHDFNNLLTIVMGFSELLLAEKDQKHPEYADLQKIFHAAKNGAELVQRLLTFSRKSEPKPVPMNLNEQIVQVEKLLRRTIPKMIDIQLELSADLPDINADRSQVEQVLMNLGVNARDAMPDKGKLTVRTSLATLDEEYCSLHVEANPGEYVVLEVSDTGMGMDKETVEHIFEPFFTTKEMGRGTGLGLAMVYGIVKQHKGHITVHSEVGKGTNFRVYLPAIPAEVETAVEESAMMVAFGTETILLVDDEEFVRELGARILTKRGYTVLQAVNGRKALDVFKKERSNISLVILDLIMPEMGGTECLKELLKIDPNVRVLIASGYSADATVKETIQMGPKGFVTKPFRVKELLRQVRKALDEG